MKPPLYQTHFARKRFALSNLLSLAEPIAIALTVAFIVSATALVFWYPLEIETRESAVWLHVLTLKAGISLYDHTQVAFVEMQKGPLDPLLKLAVHTLLPFLQPWHVIRFAVLALPVGLGAIAHHTVQTKAAKHRISAPLTDTLILTSIGYLSLLITAKEFLLVGRPDATIALLFLGFVYVSLKPLPTAQPHRIGYGLLCGTLAAAISLTNWRVAPAVIVVTIFQCWQYFHASSDRSKLDRSKLDRSKLDRSKLTNPPNAATGNVQPHSLPSFLAAYLFAAAFLLLWILGWLFQFDVSLFWAHHAGFFSEASGWGTATEGRGSFITFTLSLFNPYAIPTQLKGGPLLLAIAAYVLIPKGRKIEHRAWTLLLVFTFLSNALPYYLNYQGGGTWYFIPFVIVLWFFLLTRYTHTAPNVISEQIKRLGALLLCLTLINYQTVLSPTLSRATTLNEASTFIKTVQALAQNHTVLSEDTFLFRDTYQGELIDSGDEVTAIYETGYMGDTFSKTVEQHLNKNVNNPPDYIVTGFTESSELDDLIEAQYQLILSGPENFTADGQQGSRLFKRQNPQNRTLKTPQTKEVKK